MIVPIACRPVHNQLGYLDNSNILAVFRTLLFTFRALYLKKKLNVNLKYLYLSHYQIIARFWLMIYIRLHVQEPLKESLLNQDKRVTTVPHLLNLNEDHMLSKLVRCYIEKGKVNFLNTFNQCLLDYTKSLFSFRSMYTYWRQKHRCRGRTYFGGE